MKTRKPFVYDAVVAGYIGVDLTPGFPHSRAAIPLAEVFRPGKLIEVEGLSIALGGVVANTGLAMRKFGRRVKPMCLVGNDIFGDIVVSKFREHGVAAGVRRTDRAGTAYGLVIAPPGVDRIFLEDPGCNGLFTAADIDYATVGKSRLFHFGYPTLMKRMFAHGGAELRKMFRRVRELGVATSLDLTLLDPDGAAGKADWRRILTAVLPYVDIFAPSIEELLCLLEPRQYARILSAAGNGNVIDAIPRKLYDRLGSRILALGVKILMIKAGQRGAYLRTGDVQKLNAATALKLSGGNWSRRAVWIPAFPADRRRMKNACGAGDCAVAGLLSAMLEGVDIERAGRYAMLAGRDNLYGVDALSGLSDWKSMTDTILGGLDA